MYWSPRLWVDLMSSHQRSLADPGGSKQCSKAFEIYYWTWEWCRFSSSRTVSFQSRGKTIGNWKLSCMMSRDQEQIFGAIGHWSGWLIYLDHCSKCRRSFPQDNPPTPSMLAPHAGSLPAALVTMASYFNLLTISIFHTEISSGSIKLHTVTHQYSIFPCFLGELVGNMNNNSVGNKRILRLILWWRRYELALRWARPGEAERCGWSTLSIYATDT